MPEAPAAATRIPLTLNRLSPTQSYRDQAYAALKQAMQAPDISAEITAE